MVKIKMRNSMTFSLDDVKNANENKLFRNFSGTDLFKQNKTRNNMPHFTAYQKKL